MATTEELIVKLYQHHEDYAQGYIQNLFDIFSDCKEAADKLSELKRIIEDMTNDHYIDYLDFYINRCRELEEKVPEILCIISDKNENSNWEE